MRQHNCTILNVLYMTMPETLTLHAYYHRHDIAHSHRDNKEYYDDAKKIMNFPPTGDDEGYIIHEVH